MDNFKSILPLPRFVRLVDNKISQLSINLLPEKKSLITILFHGIFKNEAEIGLNHVHPQQSMTVQKFEEFVRYFKLNNYCFVSPEDVFSGLDTNKNHLMITFDDGYYSNIHVLPILKKYKVPATFFISANHVKENKCFWWDVVFRERMKQGYDLKEIELEISSLKDCKNEVIEDYLLKNFGIKSMKPLGDIDRPFSPQELTDFANHEEVFLGNHTFNHEILTNLNRSEVRQEIENAQVLIEKMTGSLPSIIAYPNGNFNEDILEVCGDINAIKVGITTIHKKNPLPLNFYGNVYSLGRFTLWGNKSIVNQCKLIRSDIRLLGGLSRMLRKYRMIS